ncbi:GMC oxidoreductase [Daedaleopsis nitida]|nr:GMC oxidoreductase [Daedaleopsis nitida]
MDSLVSLPDDISGQSFDYIVIGGGTAGLVVASRLSEDPTKTVVVLEAGAAHLDDPIIDLPSSYGKFFGKPEYDWGFMTIPQEHSDNTSFYWPRLKGLGGSSAGNFYLWNRPARDDIDAWERLGNPGWNWDNFLRYSMKSETFVPPSDEAKAAERLTYDMNVHGQDGPISLGFSNLRAGYEIPMQDALEKLGLPRLADPQAGDRVGCGMDVLSVDPRTNKRTTSVAYLQRAGTRSNLKVLTNAVVTRVLSTPGGTEFVANGVEFSVNKQLFTVSATATGEVILSAGAINSPQILELSGIGDPKVISRLGIESKVDLPSVGTNVQDHLFCGMAYELHNPEKYHTIEALVDPAVAEEQLRLYAEGRGLFTLGVAGVTMCPLSAISDRADKIALEVPASGEISGLAEQYAEQVSRLRNGAASAEFLALPMFYSFPNPPTANAKHITLCTMLNHPFSRGTIHASSTNPLDSPAINPRYFEANIDLLTYIEQVKFVRKLAATEPFSDVVAREINPGPSVTSDEDIGLWLKNYLTTVHHTCGSCSMLPRDKGGVVDAELRVYGTKGLRVVDLSVVPLAPASHTQSIVYAIAEQG